MTGTVPQPAFQRISAAEKNPYDLFFEYTDDAHIQGYANGWNLGTLTDLANKAHDVITRTNPILVEGSPQTAIPGRQRELNHLSEIKARLARAIDCKRDYYENHWFGKITKYVLQLFCRWNNGNTAAITYAEDSFLIWYDSRSPMYRQSDGTYHSRFFFPMVPVWWVQNNLDTSHFFNYNPRRAIPNFGNASSVI